ncbi:hypothetical protein JCM10450v2_002896 [Rhodotorula kratochvilovae]
MPRAVPVPLPRLLALLPRNGVGASVYATKWEGKGLPVPSSAAEDAACRWEVKKVRLHASDAGKVHGRAWGVLHWKGKRVTPEDKEYELIRGGLKHLWQSAVPPPLLVQKASDIAAKRAAPAPAEA